MSRRRANHTGQIYNGRLVLSAAEVVRGQQYYVTRCLSCSKEQRVRQDALKMRGCKCLFPPAATTHGQSGTRVYEIWCGMIKRCFNKNHRAYDSYGGRGISVCAEWLTFEGFLADMGKPAEHETLDRIDNDQGYSPSNCRWATWVEQQNNRRSNRLVTANGKTMTLSQWATASGLKPATLLTRLNLGWTPEEAVMTPVRKRTAA